MIIGVITLVVTMVVDGRDFERHERLGSLPICWEKAQQTMESIRTSEHHGISITNVGVGCVIEIGDPA